MHPHRCECIINANKFLGASAPYSSIHFQIMYNIISTTRTIAHIPNTMCFSLVFLWEQFYTHSLLPHTHWKRNVIKLLNDVSAFALFYYIFWYFNFNTSYTVCIQQQQHGGTFIQNSVCSLTKYRIKQFLCIYTYVHIFQEQLIRQTTIFHFIIGIVLQTFVVEV